LYLLRPGEIDDPCGGDDDADGDVEVDLNAELALGGLHLGVRNAFGDLLGGLVLAVTRL
jgi:hypothetical protein